MILKSLTVESFRNFSNKKTFNFNDKQTWVVGNNAVGKTNLLEAIYFINNCHGFREKQLDNLLENNKENALVKAKYYQKETNEENTFSIRLQKQKNKVEKYIFANDLKKDHKVYIHRTVPTVLFQPADIAIITGAPSLRRHYFNQILERIDYVYYQAKNNYQKGLYKRNKLLENQKKYQSNNFLEVLRFWDTFLVKNASTIYEQRKAFADFLNSKNCLDSVTFSVDYKANVFSLERAEKYQKKELGVGKTLIGPQLDDFTFFKNKLQARKDLSLYGSRSEQRLVVLWLKVSELSYLEKSIGRKPIFLLDDCFSELDQENAKLVLNIANNYQTVITTADPGILKLIKVGADKIEI
jgi:DNA replication and repair protein RecF